MPLFNSIKSPESKQADVIVVLGAAVWEGGRPSPTLRRRILHAIELLKRGHSDVLILTGGIGKNPPSEAQVMKRIAIEKGVTEEQIIVEESAKSTLDSAYACSKIIRMNRWSSALIVTDRYHVLRSAFLFRQFGIRVFFSTPDDVGFTLRSWKFWYSYSREYLALPWNLFRVCIRKFVMRKQYLQ